MGGPAQFFLYLYFSVSDVIDAATFENFGELFYEYS